VPIRNLTRSTTLATAETWAVTGATRAKGLLDRDSLGDGEGLVISPCNSVHMFGMRFPLDVLFVDVDGVVVRAHENLAPGQFTRIHLRARRAIELPVGVIAASGTVAGDRLDLGEIPDAAQGSSLLPWFALVTAVTAASILWLFR